MQSSQKLEIDTSPAQGDRRSDTSTLAEAALRNLHMDCHCPAPDGRAFSSRLTAFRHGELVATAPVSAGQPVQLSAGQVVVCSCRLGQEVLRFTARVAAGDASPNATEKENPPLHLADIAELKVVQRRRYYRIGLAGRQPSGATCWLVEQRPGGLPRVCSQLEGQIVDVSESGIGVILVDDARLLEQAQGLQMWVRFTLPDENESLIFRAALRHMETSQGRSRVGLEFVEYVEPGQHQAVIDRLAKFAARTG